MQIKLMYDGKGLTIRPNNAEEARTLWSDAAWMCDAADNIVQGQDQESTDPEDIKYLKESKAMEKRLTNLFYEILKMSRAWGNKHKE